MHMVPCGVTGRHAKPSLVHNEPFGDRGWSSDVLLASISAGALCILSMFRPQICQLMLRFSGYYWWHANRIQTLVSTKPKPSPLLVLCEMGRSLSVQVMWTITWDSFTSPVHKMLVGLCPPGRTAVGWQNIDIWLACYKNWLTAQQQRWSELQSKWSEGVVTDRKAVERRNQNYFFYGGSGS